MMVVMLVVMVVEVVVKSEIFYTDLVSLPKTRHDADANAPYGWYNCNNTVSRLKTMV
jgi:hypothetical protein